MGFIQSALIIGWLVCVVLVQADDPVQYFDWNVSYSKASILGVEKQIVTINDQFPGPILNTTTNNILNVNVHNNLDVPFLLTWNGIQQRRDSWQDGVPGTNCPIPPGQNWTYSIQVKDQIGSFFYYPSLALQRADGGFGPIRINNRIVIPTPFPTPAAEFDILVGDWYTTGHNELRASLDMGSSILNHPAGILINGQGPYGSNFTVKPGSLYRFRFSNVGLKTSINFRIQNHRMRLIEVEGSHTLQNYYDTLDIHPGQSYSVLVNADQPIGSYYMVASSRFLEPQLNSTAVLQYAGLGGVTPSFLSSQLPPGPNPNDYTYSIEQARSIRWNLTANAARPNPQGSFHYGSINITRTIVLENNAATIDNLRHYTVNGRIFVYPDTPLKLADYYQIPDVFTLDAIADGPSEVEGAPSAATSVVDADYKAFIQIVFQNPEPTLQSWHLDGYSFFVVGMGEGKWNDSMTSFNNKIDAIFRCTTQVYPNSWTAILLELDNEGMWNLRSMKEDRRYLGQELYLRVKGNGAPISPRDELPIPSNALKCGRASSLP
ncbi:hypothetical protein AMTRI_Chr09g41620 [Amborella trichopoda]